MTPHCTHEPRWRRLPEERPRQILDAALEVFAERGLASARLDDIAKRAGIAKGTLYLYFPNKDELFRAVVRESVISHIEEGERAMAAASGTATEALMQLARAHWCFLRSPTFAALGPLVMGELATMPELARFYSDEVLQRGLRLVSGILERGMAAGELRTMDPLVAARMLMAVMLSHALWGARRQVFVHVPDDEQVFAEIMQFYFNAVKPAPADAVR